MRTYKRKSNRGAYTEQALQNAIRAIEEGTALKAAAHFYVIIRAPVNGAHSINGEGIVWAFNDWCKEAGLWPGREVRLEPLF